MVSIARSGTRGFFYISLIFGGMALVVAIFGAFHPSSAAQPDVERGKKIFNSQICRDCHKMEGRGGLAAPDLTEEWKRGRARDWIIGHLRHPHNYEHFTIMPDFNFSEEDEQALADYLLAPK